MVIAAVEAAYDAGRGEVDVARFLGLLGDSTRRWEQQQADTLLSQAMEAVTEPTGASTENSTSTSITIISRWCLYPVLVLSPVAAMLQEVSFVFHCNNNFMVL